MLILQSTDSFNFGIHIHHSFHSVHRAGVKTRGLSSTYRLLSTMILMPHTRELVQFGMFLSSDPRPAGVSRPYRHSGKGVHMPHRSPHILIVEGRFVEFCKRDTFVLPISDTLTRLHRINISPLPLSLHFPLDLVRLPPFPFYTMAWFKEVLTWVLAFSYVLYDHIARAIRPIVAVFKAGPQAEPILSIAVTRNSFNNEFNPVQSGIITYLGYLTSTRPTQPYHGSNSTPL